MADLLPAIAWLRSQRERYGIVIRKMTWPEKQGLPLFDYEVQLRDGAAPAIGRGLDAEEPYALIKALAESLERQHGARLGLRSSGLAAHLDRGEAEAHARRELFEHDALYAWIAAGRVPSFTPVRDSLLQGFGALRFETADLSLFADVPVHLVVARDGKRVVSYGLGAGPTAPRAALLESLPSAAHYHHGGPPRPGLVEGWLQNGRPVQAATAPDDSRRIVFSSEEFGLLDSPFVGVRVRSADLQGYLAPGYASADVNAERLARIGAFT